MRSNVAVISVLAVLPEVANAFSPSSYASTVQRSTTSIKSAVDPNVVTKKEFDDIAGKSFEQTMEERLKKTSYLYPKHVEVLEDFSPMVDDMVDNIVSACLVRMRLVIDGQWLTIDSRWLTIDFIKKNVLVHEHLFLTIFVDFVVD